MKTIPGALLAHYQQEVTTVATCWYARLKSSEVFGFTDAASDLTIGGVIYRAGTGYVPSEVQLTSAMNVDNLEVRGILDSPAITEEALFSGKWDGAYVVMFRVNYMDLTMGNEMLLDGYLGHVSVGRNTFTAEIRGLLQLLQQPIGRSYSAACDATFCDARCKLPILSFTYAGIITSLSSGRVIFATGLTQAAGFFTNGLITMTSGAANGLYMDVKQHLAGGELKLSELFAIAPMPADTFSIVRGCDKSRETCNNVYGNIINFRGFRDLPGYDRLISGS